MKQKLLFFINTLAGGGAEKVLVDLVNAIPSDLFDISVLTIQHGVNEQNLHPHIHYRCIIPGNNRIFTKLCSAFLCKVLSYRFFARLFIGKGYDTIIAYLQGFNTRVVASSSAKKRIAFVHSDLSKAKTIECLYKNQDELFKEYLTFDSVCFVSETAKSGFESTYGILPNSQVLYNIIDSKSVINKSKESVEETYTTSGLRLISVGRIAPVKGFDRLLRVVKRLNEEGLLFELWILGEGNQRPELEAFCDNNGISNVKFLGYRSNPYPYILKADIMVCSSILEGYSTTVYESVVLGTPVLTTKCSGMQEILANGQGGVIVENSEKGLYDGLKKILGSPDYLKELAKKARIRSNELQSPDHLSQYIDLLR